MADPPHRVRPGRDASGILQCGTQGVEGVDSARSSRLGVCRGIAASSSAGYVSAHDHRGFLQPVGRAALGARREPLVGRDRMGRVRGGPRRPRAATLGRHMLAPTPATSEATVRAPRYGFDPRAAPRDRQRIVCRTCGLTLDVGLRTMAHRPCARGGGAPSRLARLYCRACKRTTIEGLYSIRCSCTDDRAASLARGRACGGFHPERRTGREDRHDEGDALGV